MKRGRPGRSLFWALAASKVVPGAGTHPLCRVLEENDCVQLAKLPALYTCREDDGGKATTCSPTKIEPERRTLAGAPSVGSGSVTGESAERATVSWIAESTTSSTWLICGGTRDGATHTATEARSRVDCRGYFAVYGMTDDPDQSCRTLRRKYGQEEDVSSTERPVFDSTEITVAVEDRTEEVSLVVDQSAHLKLEQPLVHSYRAPNRARSMVEQQSADDIAEAAYDDVQRRADLFVNTMDDRCDSMWTSWPAVQKAAIARGTFLVFNLFPSIGNLFNTLHDIVKIARLLEVAVVFNWKRFEGFRVAFDPADIMWDLDSSEIVQRADQLALGPKLVGLHSLKFHDGVMILADSQLEMLAQGMGVVESDLTQIAKSIEEIYSQGLRLLLRTVGQSVTAPQPCAWNMLLRRSASMMASLAEQRSWMQPGDSSGLAPQPRDYVAWHIRTSVGESERSFKPGVHKHVFHNQPSSIVCALYFWATDQAEAACRNKLPGDFENLPIYISSNSQGMSRNCTSDAAGLHLRAGFVDLGLADSDAHTKFSKDPATTAAKALMDYLFLMDATMIVRTSSSFSGTVAKIKGLQCSESSAADALDMSGLKLCLPGC